MWLKPRDQLYDHLMSQIETWHFTVCRISIKKLVEQRSLTSRLPVDQNNTYQITFIVCAISSECALYPNIYQQ